MRLRITLSVLALLLCALPLSAAALDVSDWIWDVEFWDETDGDVLGTEGAVLPVLSAPYDDAWRGGGGKACVSTAKPFTLYGCLQDQTWVMVGYRIDFDASRIGWVRVDPEKCDFPDRNDLTIQRRLCRVTRETAATDDPLSSQRRIRTLTEGETVIAMLAFGDQNMVYVETEVDGRPAWLFADADALEEVPTAEVDGSTVRYLEGVTILGDAYDYIPVRDEDGLYLDSRVSCRVEPGDIAAPSVDLNMDYGFVRGHVILPDSLRVMGPESIHPCRFDELRLPSGLVSASLDAFYGCDFDRLIISAGCTSDLPAGDYVTVSAYVAEEGNPRYMTRDGVLFSADGKTLIKYPNGKRDLHYDVPAGVEEIAALAFDDDMHDIPLQTISLPIGLRRIGNWAFCGCGRLQSLTVPLTVTEIAESAFYECVSLERLSLPPGLTAGFGEGAEQADFTWYSGDNGSIPRDEVRRTSFSSFDAWVDNPWAKGSVTLYRDAWRRYVLSELPVGTIVLVRGTVNGMVRVDCGKDSGFMEPGSFTPVTPNGAVFTVCGAVHRETGERYGEYEVNVSHGRIRILAGEIEDERWGYIADWRESPRDEFTLLCRGSGGRTAAILCAPADVPVILIHDAPDGAVTAHTYDCDQAVVLEERDGWTLIRTLRAQGWVRSEHIWIVEPDPEAP